MYLYSVYFNASIIDFDNEVGITLDGITGGLKGETIETIQYIYTYDFTQPAEPTVSNTAKKLRNPLPLMGMFSNFTIYWEEEPYHLTTICNSTISNFQFNASQRMISFNVTGPDYTLGFCRITIPNVLVQELWNGNYTVLVDEKEPITMKSWTDRTYTYLYFTYMHSEHQVEIVPEFPTWTSILLILIVLTVATATYKRRLLKTSIR